MCHRQHLTSLFIAQAGGEPGLVLVYCISPKQPLRTLSYCASLSPPSANLNLNYFRRFVLGRAKNF